MTLTIEALLRQKIGLDTCTLSSGIINRAIQQRMADCSVTDLQIYLTQLQTSNQELEALIETVVVPETWFFRYPEAFVFLSRYVISEWLPGEPNAILRVLSVPCSTGEEPYSIAIALIEAGLATKNFRIDAVDISNKSIQKAKLAVYSRNSFRSEDLGFRKRHFLQKGDEYHLCEEVKNTVNFVQGNLLDPDLLNNKQPYDVIFCRNVLIYFDDSARKHTLQFLERLLKNQGLLFVGHSETQQVLTSQFVSVQHPSAFAYRKSNVNVKNNPTPKQEQFNSANTRPPTETLKLFKQSLPTQTKNLQNRSAAFVNVATPLKTSATPELPTVNLETARSLADSGKLNEAATQCQTYLNQNPTSAEAYVLLGQLRQALGNEEIALACFQKAIYLEPNYYEALVHLALLKEQRGDIASAKVLRQRIQKLPQLSEQ
ncbi:CheR family methyltransferase [Iningainema tapete]|uniref:Methyltransferase domain-containing protein n=1 Tax=Iningainema tapete BLCC-T55 TaxID=2748662 RepID=A0A8J6XKB3_9CYAN|nr:protein-glutamate O-methyltransferase CheR [Iningainema tapete]MBD2774161.1 methyltransferase domain-containing protein [Iningainema tapete BLCC-T55]